MADWKQITARIRRARTSKDPQGQLTNLFEKTRDAMVAFELAKFFESAGQTADAAKYYSEAAQRFRRADWKTKAREAAERLGGTTVEIPSEVSTSRAEEPEAPPPAVPLQVLPAEQSPEALESAVAVSSELQQATEAATSVPPSTGKRRRRRGRRGGRNRRKGTAPVMPEAQRTEAATAQKEIAQAEVREPGEPLPPRTIHSRAIPIIPVEPAGELGGASARGRYGDPGLSSRISLLEMQFRRLLACSPAKLSEADHAPAGPGVLVLTDSDMTSYYFVEACQTLRIAIGHLMRGGSRKGSESIKPRLAEHLGIPEARVGKYLADHCVVRWLQLDEGASNFAHFAIAVLRPILND